ncbi:MAG TPA: IgGFc-binding protein [Flavobacterium sp.]|jgi:hypothetical protein
MRNLFLWTVLLLCLNASSQFSKTHYIPPLAASDVVIPDDQYIYISTPNVDAVNFKINQIGGATIEGTVSKSQPYVHAVGFGQNTRLIARQNNIGSVLSDKGYIIEAEDMIYVSARVIAGNGNNAGALVSKGLAALGTEFRAGAFINTALPSYNEAFLTFISVMATENNTTVQISGMQPGIQLTNQMSSNTPQSIVLNSGQSYVIAAQGPNDANRDGLIGALVTSDKPIAMNCGSFGGTNGEMSNIDLGFDQIVPAELTGTEYIFIKATGQAPVERILLIAHENGTQVFVNGSSTPIVTMFAGAYFSLNGNSFNENGSLHIQTSKNVFAYQSIGDDGREDQANQEMFFVPPLSCKTPHVIDNIPMLNQVGSRTFDGRVTIVTKAGSTLEFIIDDVSYSLAQLGLQANVQGPLAVTGTSEYETYNITGLEGNLAVYSTGEIYLASYGSDDAATIWRLFFRIHI